MTEKNSKKIEETPMQARLKAVAQYFNLTVKAFELRIKASNGWVSNTRESIREDKVEAIIREFPAVSRVWLKTGEGDMIKPDMNAPLFQVARENGQNKFVSPPMAEFEALRRENELLRAQVASLTQERDDYRTKFFEAQRELIDVLKQGRQK